MRQLAAAETGTHRLGNGLRVTVAPARTEGVVAVAVHYNVGFRSEPAGRSGFAHLFEHLMFQGGADRSLDHFRQVESVGGFCNASTRQDYTDFYNVVPASGLAHVLALEADRMRAPRLTEHAILAQVAVVREEILTKTRRPYGGYPWPLLSGVLFQTYPNAHDGYGDYEALADVTVAECQDFFARHYRPADAVLTIAGDVDPAAALDLAENLFGGIPGGAPPEHGTWWEPPPTRRVPGEHHDPYAALPAVAVGYRIPDPVAHPDAHVALAALADLLAGGARPLLEDAMRAAGCHAGPVSARCGLFDVLDARDPDLWTFTAVHGARTDAERVLDVFDAQVRRLAAEGPTGDELAVVRARTLNTHHRAMDQPAGRVRALGRFALLFADAGMADTLPDRFERLGTADIADAARSLAHDARAVLTATVRAMP